MLLLTNLQRSKQSKNRSRGINWTWRLSHCAKTSVSFSIIDIKSAVLRNAVEVIVDYVEVPQDIHLANNQFDKIRCGDNGIFKVCH